MASPFVITGLKAAQPGGASNLTTNTLAPKFTAPPAQQKATSTTASSSSAPSVSNLLLGPLTPKPQAASSQGIAPNPSFGAGLSVGPTGQVSYTKPSTPVKSTTVGADGSFTQTYHAPETPATPSTPTGASSGTATTPSGATVNTTTGQVTSQPPANSFEGLIGNLVGTASGNTAIGQNAANIAASYGKKISDVGQQAAKAQAGYETTGTTPVGEGNAAVIARTAAAQQQALASGETAALAGTGQQLTAEQQAQQGIGAAAGLAAPQLGQFGQTYYSPLGGGTIGSGQGGSFDQAMNTYIDMAVKGQYSAIPSSITSNPVLNAEVIQGAKNKDSSFDPITSGAKGASAADLTQQASAIQAQANGAEANFELMTNIAKQGGVNDLNVPILNTLQNNVARGLASNEAVVNFQSLIQSVRSQYASILGGGTVTVEALQEAQQLVPNDISLSALTSLGTNLKSDAQNRVAGINNQVQTLTGGSQNAQSTGQPNPWH